MPPSTATWHHHHLENMKTKSKLNPHSANYCHLHDRSHVLGGETPDNSQSSPCNPRRCKPHTDLSALLHSPLQHSWMQFVPQWMNSCMYHTRWTCCTDAMHPPRSGTHCPRSCKGTCKHEWQNLCPNLAGAGKHQRQLGSLNCQPARQCLLWQMHPLRTPHHEGLQRLVYR